MKTQIELREELNELLDEAKALTNLAEKEGRELTEAEATRWSDLMAENTGLVAKKQVEVEARTKLEREKKVLALARANNIEGQNPLNGAAIDDGRRRATVDSQPRHVTGTLRAFKGPNAVKDARDSGMYLRAAVARMRHGKDEIAEQHIEALGWKIHNAATEGTGAAGGFLVPDPMAAAIINYRALSGVSRKACRVVPMTADTLDLPKKTGRHTVYYPGEGGTITASQQTFGQVNLVAVKRAVLTQVSQELVDDAIVSIVDDIVSEIGSDLAIQEDAELINGDSTSTYGGETGLLALLGAGGISSAVTGHDLWAEIDLADVMAWLGLLPSKFAASGNASIICSSNFYFTVLCRVAIGLGGTTQAALFDGVTGQPMFWGKNVYFTDQMPTATAAATVHALYGDFQKAVVIGDRMGIAIGQSDQYAFANDLLTIRATARYDINVHEPGTASVAGAVVGLKSAA